MRIMTRLMRSTLATVNSAVNTTIRKRLNIRCVDITVRIFTGENIGNLTNNVNGVVGESINLRRVEHATNLVGSLDGIVFNHHIAIWQRSSFNTKTIQPGYIRIRGVINLYPARWQVLGSNPKVCQRRHILWRGIGNRHMPTRQ